jgi:hypothetical protein
MISLDFKAATAGFFDRKAVTSAVDKATRRVLSKFGAFVRTRARTSMRRRKGVSAPGDPPHAHTGLIKRFLFFSYDRERKSVVIGPAKLNRVVSSTALPALEYGGRTQIEDRRGARLRTANVDPRPFMGPAYQAEAPKLPAMWRDSVR